MKLSHLEHLISAVVFSTVATAASDSGNLRVGAAKIDITPAKCRACGTCGAPHLTAFTITCSCARLF
jgi:hypothetical protein